MMNEETPTAMPRDWRMALGDWLTRNPKTAPENLRKLRDEFVQRFPKERLEHMTLRQYALGHDDYKDSFCYWLERKTEVLGSIRGGNVTKFWVWWDGDTKDWKWIEWLEVDTAERALSAVLERLVVLVQQAEHGDMEKLDDSELPPSLRAKPLSLYFPDRFLPIANETHLTHFLGVFGLVVAGGLHAQNRQLLDFLRAQSEFGGFDTLQMMRFLYDCFPPAVKLGSPPEKPGMRIWKIAPGEDARLWAQLRDHGFIGIGWRELGDLSRFKDRDDCAQALQKAGLKTGGATCIEYFVRHTKAGDIVVANKGRDEVAGLGVITGDFEYNPALAAKTQMEYPNLRKVEWRVTKSVASPVRFARQTITKSSDADLEQIKQAYHKAYPDDRELLQAIESLGTAPAVKTSFPASRLNVNRSPNWVFYGPPGTGKTWSALHEVRQWLLAENGWRKEAGQYAALRDREDEASRNELKRLAALVEGTGEQKEIRYWWATTNPDYWKWDELFRKGAEVWNPGGRIQRNYKQIGMGDLVFGYVSSPTQEIVAVARVTRLLSRKNQPTFEVEPVQRITVPLNLAELLENPLMKNSEPLRHRAQGTLFKLTKAEAEELERLLREKGNELKFSVKAGQGYLEFVTFHQSYSYEDFVEGLRPKLDSAGKGEVSYEIKDGVFKRLCQRAKANRDHWYALVIDEINRGNISKVFGELITLIERDKRLDAANEIQVTLPYSGKLFGVPRNVLVVGTMNTADRSIALLDVALRRRFTFVELMPDPKLLGESSKATGMPLDKLLTALNRKLEAHFDRDHQIGHSYFMHLKSLEDLRFAWEKQIMPLVQEYFYGDGAKLKDFLGSDFITSESIAVSGDGASEQREVLRVRELQHAKFSDALMRVANTAPSLSKEPSSPA